MIERAETINRALEMISVSVAKILGGDADGIKNYFIKRAKLELGIEQDSNERNRNKILRRVK